MNRAPHLRLRSSLVVATAIAALAVPPVAPPAFAADDVVVDVSRQHQVIRGFGGMTHSSWIGDLTPSQRDTAFDNGADDLGMTVLRIPVPESQDRGTWSGDLATAQAAVQKGALVIASPWNPPADMTETDPSGRKRLAYDQYDRYAQHLEDFVGYMRENGVELYGISIQNEPDYAHDWTWWTPEEIVRFLTDHAHVISTRVIAPESFQYLKNMSDPILDDPAALANTDIIGAHLYGTPYSDFGYPLFEQKGGDKELWMTEVYTPNSEAGSGNRWPEALEVGEHIHHAMADAGFQAYIWWYIRRDYGPIGEDGAITKRGSMMAHYTKFVRPGDVRVEATKEAQPGVLTSAYVDDGGEVTLVAVNSNTDAVEQDITLDGLGVAGAEAWVTDANRDLQQVPAGTTSGGTLTANLPAQSVTTFVLDTTSGQSTPPPATTPPPADDACTARLSVVNSWGDGYQAEVTVTAGSAPISGWAVTLPGGIAPTQVWNGSLSGSTVTNGAWNGDLGAGATASFGFIGSGSPPSGASLGCSG